MVMVVDLVAQSSPTQLCEPIHRIPSLIPRLLCEQWSTSPLEFFGEAGRVRRQTWVDKRRTIIYRFPLRVLKYYNVTK